MEILGNGKVRISENSKKILSTETRLKYNNTWNLADAGKEAVGFASKY